MGLKREVFKMNCECYKNEDVAPIPMEGEWICLDNISKINGVSHGVGGCPPHQGACKLTLNVKNGIIAEALIETVGCSGITQSAVIASEILTGKNILEALNVHLVCDAINVAMKNAFLQFVYGRTQTAFSYGGLPIGSLSDELAEGKLSHVGTVISSETTPSVVLHTTEGYITRLALNSKDQIIGYQYLLLAKMLADLKSGKFISIFDYLREYGRYSEGTKFIDPRGDNSAI